VQKAIGKGALGRSGLEVVLVFGKIFGHGDELAADLVPGLEHGLRRAGRRFDGGVFFHCVLAVGRDRNGCSQQSCDEKW
jgi:hypothetical protein